MEQFTIEKLEKELLELYTALQNVSDPEERKHIQHNIQQRNLQLMRLQPNE